MDTYALGQTFQATGDGTSPALRLDAITHTGNDGGTLAAPAVTFLYNQMANRVPGSGTWPAMEHYRITAIDDETGASTDVTYSAADCNQSGTSPDLPTSSSDTRRCYEEYWTPPKGALTADWFEKYTVSQVETVDNVSTSPVQYTKYTYVGNPAWHRNDSPLTVNTHRTWDQWRGYGQVITETGHAPDPITESETTYLRGMDGDSQSATGGSPRTVTVTDGAGDVVSDSNQYAGSVLETQAYNVAGGHAVKDDISLPWSALTATHAESATGTPAGVPAEKAYFVAPQTTLDRGLMADGTNWRTVKSVSCTRPAPAC